MRVKMAVVPPMPRASVRIAARENTGSRRGCRRVYRMTSIDPNSSGILPGFRRKVNKAPGESRHFRNPALSFLNESQGLTSGNIGEIGDPVLSARIVLTPGV